MNSRDKSSLNVLNSLAYGVAYVEMAKINLLTTQVQDATYSVTENQAIVAALSDKLAQFNGYLTEATNNRSNSLNMLNAVKDMHSNVNSLASNVSLANKQTNKATFGISSVAQEMSDLVNKLIFSTELIEKFGQIVNKQKQINPLIPDSLISLISKATTDANKAISLTLVALQSAYAAEATSLAAQSLGNLEDSQAQALLQKITVNANPHKDKPTLPELPVSLTAQGSGILALMQANYADSNQAYNQALHAVNMVTTQLNHAQAALDAANTQLSSYSAGLAAATAAAYAA